MTNNICQPTGVSLIIKNSFDDIAPLRFCMKISLCLLEKIADEKLLPIGRICFILV
jgi:hypothetical protein